MAHEANDKQIDIQLLDQPDHRINDVTRHEVRLDRHTGGCRLCLCGCDDRRKTMVRLYFSSATSSMLAGNRGSSSTVTMWTSAKWGRASSSAAVRAF